MKNNRQNNFYTEEGCQQCGSGFVNCDCSDFFMEDLDDCGFCSLGACDCYDDVCCYDPRYRGPENYCHCHEHTKAMEREMHWFLGRWDRMGYWLRSKLYSVKRRFKNIFSNKSKAIDSDDLPF